MATLEPISKALPGDDGRYQRQRIGTLHRESPVIFIYETVLEEILEFSEQDLRRELGGFLAGGLFEDDEEHCFIEVQHFLPATDAKSQAAKLTFTHDCLAARDRQLAEQAANILDRVGDSVRIARAVAEHDTVEVPVEQR